MSDKPYNTGRRLTPVAYKQFPHLVAAGFSISALANFFDIAPSTVHHILRKMELRQRHENQSFENFFGIQVDDPALAEAPKAISTKPKRAYERASKPTKTSKPSVDQIALAAASDGSRIYNELPLHWRNKMSIFVFEEFLSICTKPEHRLAWSKKHGYTEQFSLTVWHFVRPKLKA